MFEAVLTSTCTTRKEIHKTASINIKKAQEKQKRDFDRRHLSKIDIKVGDKVLLKNNKRSDRKGGKFTYILLGPYTVKDLAPKGLATLENLKGDELKKKYSSSQLKAYVQNISSEEEADKSQDDQLPKLPDVPDEKNNYWHLLPMELKISFISRLCHLGMNSLNINVGHITIYSKRVKIFS